MDRMGGHDSFSSRGQRNSDIELSRAGRNMGHPNLGDGILGAKPGDISRNLASNAGSGLKIFSDYSLSVCLSSCLYVCLSIIPH